MNPSLANYKDVELLDIIRIFNDEFEKLYSLVVEYDRVKLPSYNLL
jgi:hypothetical protein